MPIEQHRAAVMSRIDDALQPIQRMSASPQPMNTAQLATAVAAIRAAFSALVSYDPLSEDLSDNDRHDPDEPELPAEPEQVTETAAGALTAATEVEPQPEAQVLIEEPAEAVQDTPPDEPVVEPEVQ